MMAAFEDDLVLVEGAPLESLDEVSLDEVSLDEVTFTLQIQ
jgi:hypothetical protein